jgi:hypothetical protein
VATIAKADNSNSLVITPSEQYEGKIKNFIDENKFHITDADPTKTFQNQVQKTVKQSKCLIPPNSTWKYTNLNPSAPSIKGLIKLHKPDLPICSVVNWKNAPAYKLSRPLTQKMKFPPPIRFQCKKLCTANTRIKADPNPTITHFCLSRHL